MGGRLCAGGWAGLARSLWERGTPAEWTALGLALRWLAYTGRVNTTAGHTSASSQQPAAKLSTRVLGVPDAEVEVVPG